MTFTTLSEVVSAHAEQQPANAAFIDGATGDQLSWHAYDQRAWSFAASLIDTFEPGDRVALQLTEIDMHVAMLACERAGVVGVGIGARAGEREVEHLVAVTGALDIITALPTTVDGHHDASRCSNSQDLWFLNSTSGTTGLPKCVMHHQARWFAFHELALASAHLQPDDVFMSLLPAPFGFGLWTAHFTPTLLGAPCVVFNRFNAPAAVAAIQRYQVSVVAAVSTQFVMMLNTDMLKSAFGTTADDSPLRVLFTGGEMVPPDRAAQWEEVTGSSVLQFYGSNETGALSATAITDDETVRLTTAGHVIEELHVRLFDPETGQDITMTGGPGIAACKGAVNCLGYYNDPEANAQLFTEDGWMKTGDLCTIDSNGVLRVAGRASDFIIRGGKNISAAIVEQESSTFPRVLLAAAVARRDPTYGERTCLFAAIAPNTEPFTLHALTQHLSARGVGKDYWPEYLVIVEGDLPRSSGGKVAKSELRKRANDLNDL